ncbi:hypothetical protein Leryth_007161 [Lithospermum erythrorhizon]|nr:hypothetical protein Leryth_007161 [Lithospermum erythrorhizon]
MYLYIHYTLHFSKRLLLVSSSYISNQTEHKICFGGSPDMASSKVMYFQQQQQSSGTFRSNDQIECGLGSMNMDDLLRSMYTEPEEALTASDTNEIRGGGGGDGGGQVAWGQLGNGAEGGGGSNNESTMTLEAYLAKAGAVTEEDVSFPGVVNATGNNVMEGMTNSVQYHPGMVMQNCPTSGFAASSGFRNGMVAVGGTSGSVAAIGGGRGKRRAVEDMPLDKTTQQKQRRMIKNRESAARSRERKHAYTVELEALVTRLEEENARLLKEEAELKKQRFKQLIGKVKPVVEKRTPPKVVMHRSLSMSW